MKKLTVILALVAFSAIAFAEEAAPPAANTTAPTTEAVPPGHPGEGIDKAHGDKMAKKGKKAKKGHGDKHEAGEQH